MYVTLFSHGEKSKRAMMWKAGGATTYGNDQPMVRGFDERNVFSITPAEPRVVTKAISMAFFSPFGRLIQPRSSALTRH